MNAALQRLLDARSLEAFPAPDEEIVSRWRVAVGAFHDSRRVFTVEMRVSVCYQAGLQAAMTLVRSAGYRLRTAAGGHHYVTFAALAALGPDRLTRIAEEMNRLLAARGLSQKSSRGTATVRTICSSWSSSNEIVVCAAVAA